MFAEFLNIVFSSLKLDKNLYRNNKNFGEAGIYFAGLIMILDGVAGAVAANTIIKTSIGISGLTAILTWLVWALFIYVIGVKIFPDKETNVSFKKVLIGVGYAHAPGLIRFFAVTPELVIPIIFLTQFWIFASLIISTKQILNPVKIKFCETLSSSFLHSSQRLFKSFKSFSFNVLSSNSLVIIC